MLVFVDASHPDRMRILQQGSRIEAAWASLRNDEASWSRQSTHHSSSAHAVTPNGEFASC